MKKISYILIFLLLLFSKEAISTVHANGNNESDFSISQNSTGVTITQYHSQVKDVEIPEIIGGKPVTAIGGSAFSSRNLTSVKIPDSVTSIESNAFAHNLLTSVVIPNNVISIGFAAFSENQLTNVVLPSSVTNIEDLAFYRNQLTSLVIPNGLISIGEDAFSHNQINSLIIPNSVTYIGDKAFTSNQLNSLEISNNLTSIGVSTFSYNQLNSLVIPNSVTSIGDAAFANNQLTTVEISNNVTTIGQSAFAVNKINSLVIPNSVISIGENAFFMNSLTSLEIPNSVTNIGNSAFISNELSSVVIPDSITSIGKSVFSNNQLNSVVIPDSITSIGDSAFSNNKLNSVMIPDSVTSIGNGAFTYNQLNSIVIPNNVTSIANYAFSDNQLNSVVIPNSVISIGNNAFSTNQLTNVVIPNSVTTIGEKAFYRNQLNSLVIPDSVISIGGWAFYINQLTSLVIPNSVTSIGEKAFFYNQLKQVQFDGQPTLVSNSFSDQTKKGVAFSGWYEDHSFTTPWTSTVLTPMTIYARWDNVLSFHSQGGSEVAKQSVAHNTTATEPIAPTKDDFTFVGWYKGLPYTIKWDFMKDVVTEDTTLYALWGYMLSFESNGGSPVPNQSLAERSTVTEPTTPTKTGFTFMGWYKDDAFKTKWDFANDLVRKDTTLYAKWAVDYYELSFESNGGSPVDNQRMADNTKAAEPTSPTKAGFIFAGWYKDNALKTKWDFANDVVTKNTTLYAKWDKESYTVSFDTDGGTPSPINQTIAFNEKASEPTAPTKKGYTFGGWYKEKKYITAWNFGTNPVTANTTLYAKWNAITPTPNPTPGEPTPSPTPGEPKPSPTPGEPKPNPTPGEPKPSPTPGEPITEKEQQEESIEKTPTITFTDISSHWAKEMIEDIATRGIITGYSDETFKPNAPITRQHVAVMFTRAFAFTLQRDPKAFSDLPTNHPYFDAINTMYRAGIFDGTNDKFNPEANMTRAQMAKVLVLALGLNTNGTSTFRDVPENHWAQDYIASLADHGIALGDKGNFKPEEPLTRSQFVVFLYRALHL